MKRNSIVILLTLCLPGCLNLHHRIDTAPDSDSPLAFQGIQDYLRDGSLHVMQVHGMGDHSSEVDCGEKSANLRLQDAIAEKLRYIPDSGYGKPTPTMINIDGTNAGSYSVSKFTDPSGQGGDLYFSCVTWGETSRIVKQGMLELNDDFREKNPNEPHRAPINRAVKRFVNRSFSDPVIYLGKMGPYIRDVLWQGIQRSVVQHIQKQSKNSLDTANARLLAQEATSFLQRTQVVVISDSMGSRIVFDVLCAKGGGACQNGPRPEVLPERELPALTRDETRVFDAALIENLSVSIQSVYMLANQLPLLELAYVQPPEKGVSLKSMIENTPKCYQPLLGLGALAKDSSPDRVRSGKVQIVAFTDVNDALSYHLTDAFKGRCAPVGNNVDPKTGEATSPQTATPSRPIEIINVTMPNARFRWLFVYSNLVKAHSEGFKENSRAIEYLVRGSNASGAE